MQSLEDLVRILMAAPEGKVLLVAGVVCILLGIVREWRGKFDIGAGGRRVALTTGAVLIGLSIAWPGVRAPKYRPAPNPSTGTITAPQIEQGEQVRVLVGGQPTRIIDVTNGRVTFRLPDGAQDEPVTLQIGDKRLPVLGRPQHD